MNPFIKSILNFILFTTIGIMMFNIGVRSLAKYMVQRRVQDTIRRQLEPPDACTKSRMDYARRELAKRLKIEPQGIEIYEPSHVRAVFVLMRLSATERERLYPTKRRFAITDQERTRSIARIMENQPQPYFGPVVRPDILLDSYTAYDTKSGFTVTTTSYPETYDGCYGPGWQNPRVLE